MSAGEETCWTLIREAASGEDRSAGDFVARYRPVVEAYLRVRWREGSCAGYVEDAAQEVFLECFKQGGALERSSQEPPTSFRAFLRGVVRNVALRWETWREHRVERRTDSVIARQPADDESVATAFDRAWALTILREAVALQRERAAGDADGERLVELLHLRFHEGLPIREIAKRWDVSADSLHREYPRARREFEAALKEAIRFHHPHRADRPEAEFRRLLDHLG